MLSVAGLLQSQPSGYVVAVQLSARIRKIRCDFKGQFKGSTLFFLPSGEVSEMVVVLLEETPPSLLLPCGAGFSLPTLLWHRQGTIGSEACTLPEERGEKNLRSSSL